ncbi:MAG: TonB-dependent receptor [Verrucomicrobia bacterium]|nr:TonB-dependent receptor [Verrucomicrobiota bacterium]
MNTARFYCDRRSPRITAFSLLLSMLLVPAATSHGQIGTNQQIQAELKKLSLEELMQVEVSSVSRRPEALNEVPSAIQVITGSEIRRSGARSIPEALRIASNLHVAQVDSRQWAISARGFNASVANKLLVMIDGRSVYTPLFSGVFWDVQDTLLEDIDRIEVVSGPGATLWGANAVNGVINIVTKSAKDPSAQGTLLTAGGGTEERGLAGIRHGGKLAENVYYRVYGKYFNRDSAVRANGTDNKDDWQFGQGGFRIDWDATTESLLTFQGDLYGGDINQAINDNITVGGGNFLSRWNRTISEDSDLQVQFYYDRTYRRIPGTFAEDLDTYDLDFQHRFHWMERNEIVWGLGYRLIVDDVDNIALAFLPEELTRHVFSAFVQDKIEIVEDKLFFTLGTKIEHNDYTGVEIQPSARAAWLPLTNQTVWAAVSRAVRTPSRIDRHLFAPSQPPFLIAGGPGFDSEEVIAYEVGYRFQPMQRLSVSIATFFNEYDRLRSVTPGPPLMIENGLEGETYGVELDATYRVTEAWRLRFGYTFLKEDIRVKPGFVDVNLGRAETSDPRHQFSIRSLLDLPKNFELDLAARYVDRLHNISGGQIGTVPGYAELDARLGWRPRKDLEFSIVGQNLLHDRHPEFGFSRPTRPEIERSVYGKVTWRF